MLFLIAACNGDKGDTSSGVLPEAPPLVINEFLAENDTINTDEAGEFEDWVEIYNTGDTLVSYEGLYLTDEREVSPTKWALPEGGGIEPGGYDLFWCDLQVEQGEGHTSFALEKNGEELSIYYVEAGQEVRVDAIDYEPQAPDLSYARVPDGSVNWMQGTPTPKASNG